MRRGWRPCRCACLASRTGALARHWRTAASLPETRRCDSLAEAHVVLSATLQQHLAACRPASLASLVHEVRRWWQEAARCVRVSRDLHAVPDFPLFLLDTVRAASDEHRGQDAVSSAEDELARGRRRFMQMPDEHILQEFEEWLVTSSPPRVAPAAAPAAVDESAEETISYASLMGLVSSYIRYHAGVRWGASLPPATSALADAERDRSLASYHRRVYYLHPWHDVYCPAGQAAQMPYVHVLRWMLAGARRKGRQAAADASSNAMSRLLCAQGGAAGTALGTTGALGEEERRSLWAEHRATQYFDPPCWHRRPSAAAREPHRGEDSTSATTLAALCRSFRALDVCCQSGFAVDLLLRAGAHDVTATDALPSALGSTEATVQDHLRDRRGAAPAVAGLRRAVHVELSDLVPCRSAAVAPLPPSPPPVAPGATNATAAARRRQLARWYDRALPAALHRDAPPCAAGDGGGSYDVLYYHPPPHPLLPMRALPWQPARRSAWWREVAAAARRYGATLRPLPSVVCPVQGLRHPHGGTRRLHDLVELLRADVTRQRGATTATTARPAATAAEPPALLHSEGYAVLVLPSVFDPDEVLRGGPHPTGHANSPPLAPSDWVVAQLDGLYTVVLRRRHRARGGGPVVAEQDGDCGPKVTDARLLRSLLEHSALSPAAATFYDELVAPYARGEVWTDVLVLQKSAAAVRECRAACEAAHETSQRGARYAAVQRMRQLQSSAEHAAELRHRIGLRDAPGVDEEDDDGDGNDGQSVVRWRDSLEYHEYKPRSAAATRYHWTDMLPSFSYLERDWWAADELTAAQGNYLAVGHPPQLAQLLPPPTPTPNGAAASEEAGVKSGNALTAAAAAAAMGFRSVFAEELRTRRRPKLRKLATASLQQQEWFIDEKLIKSEAAKVDFMNELARWDLKDYD